MAFKREIKVYRLVNKDPRTSKLAKFQLGFEIGHALTPFDIILIIVPTLVFFAVTLVPKEVMAECRLKAQQTQLS